MAHRTPTTGLLSGGDSPLFQGAAGAAGLLGYNPITPTKTVDRGSVDVPIDLTMFEGANKYEYPVFEWGGTQQPEYTYAGHTTADIDEYPYYPYMPYGGEAARSRNDRILVGQRLIPK